MNLAVEYGDKNYLNQSRNSEIIRYLEGTDLGVDEDLDVLEYWKSNQKLPTAGPAVQERRLFATYIFSR